MKRVDKSHLLVLDISTDKSHLVKIDDESQSPLLTFDSSLNCFDAAGQKVARVSMSNNHWILKTELEINISPVPCEIPQSAFVMEKEFCKKWLEQNNN